LCLSGIDALASFAPGHEYVMYGFSQQAPECVEVYLRRGFKYCQIQVEGEREEYLRLGCAAPFLWSTPQARELDVYHVTSPFMPDILLPTVGPCSIAATLLDAIPYAMHERQQPVFGEDMWTRYLQRSRIVEQYQHFMAISQSAAEDCARLLGLDRNRISISYVPVDQWPRADEAALQKLRKVPAQYILTVTGYNFRKNLNGTLEAFAALPKQVRKSTPLVMVCSLERHERAEVEAQITRLGLRGQVILTGYLSDEELQYLLERATVFLFLSNYEGFGLPVAEAMAAGVPVVCSNNSSLPEVAGKAALLVSQNSPDEVALALKTLLQDKSLREQKMAQGFMQVSHFSPEAYAAKIESAYALANRLQATTLPSCASSDHADEAEIAVFSPITPRMSGIAEYTEQLLLHLGEECGADIFIEDYKPAHHAVREKFACYHYSAFVRRHARRPYRSIIYQLGNNALHAYMLPFIEHYPGIVVLHDYSLLGLYRLLAQKFGEAYSCKLRFKHEYPDADSNCWDHLQSLDTLSHFDFPMTHTLLRYSRRIVTHSRWLSSQLEEIAGLPPIEVVPMGAAFNHVLADRPGKAELRRRYYLPEDAFVIVSMGVINRLKRLMEVVKAFRDFQLEHRNSYFVLIGPAEPDLLQQMNRFLAQTGIKHCVRFLGHRETSELYDVLALSDVCVNLRYPSMGESSATLMAILAMGRPALVTPIAQFSEFPDWVCWKVGLGPQEHRQLIEYFRKLQQSPETGEELGRRAQEFARGAAWHHVAEYYRRILANTLSQEMIVEMAGQIKPAGPN
jgi:glycosyltransferase involved in cell wall biosynthesis